MTTLAAWWTRCLACEAPARRGTCAPSCRTMANLSREGTVSARHPRGDELVLHLDGVEGDLPPAERLPPNPSAQTGPVRAPAQLQWRRVPPRGRGAVSSFQPPRQRTNARPACAEPARRSGRQPRQGGGLLLADSALSFMPTSKRVDLVIQMEQGRSHQRRHRAPRRPT